jgi:hypothetical protein
MDAIVADAEKGSSHATSLLNMLTSEIDDEEDADAASDAYVEKINKLLFRAIVSGNLVSSKGLGTVRSMFNSDTRIVWTNDRSADGELVQDFVICSNAPHFSRLTSILDRFRMSLLDCC